MLPTAFPIASGRVNTTGDTAAAGFYARRCAVARSAQGIYTITLDQQVDSAQSSIAVTSETAGVRVVQVVHTSDLVKTVNFVDAAAAAQDAVWNFEIKRTN